MEQNKLNEDNCNNQTFSQRFTNAVKTQWGRLIACLPELDSVGTSKIDF